MREIPLDAARDPGPRHADQTGLDRRLPIEPDVVVGLVQRTVQTSAYLREDHGLDKLVFQDHRVVGFVDLLVRQCLI